MRKLLTEEQREELDDECRRYALWRRQTKLGPDDFIHDMLNSRTDLTQYGLQQQQQQPKQQQQPLKQQRQKRSGNGSGVNTSSNNVNPTTNRVVNSSPEKDRKTLIRHTQEQPETITVDGDIDAVGRRDSEIDVESITVNNEIGVETDTVYDRGGLDTTSNDATNNGVVDPTRLAAMNVNWNASRHGGGGMRSQRSKKESDCVYDTYGDSVDESRRMDYLSTRVSFNSLTRVTFREEESYEFGRTR